MMEVMEAVREYTWELASDSSCPFARVIQEKPWVQLTRNDAGNLVTRGALKDNRVVEVPGKGMWLALWPVDQTKQWE